MLNFIMCSVNFSAKGWTAVFVRFGMIFSGTLLDSSNAWGYQDCFDHAGKTRIPVAWSWHNFLMTFVSKLNWGNTYMNWCLQFIEKASTAKASSFGFQETYFSVWSLIQLANKSISGVPKVSHTALYILGFNCHSVASWNFLECLPASKFCVLHLCVSLY